MSATSSIEWTDRTWNPVRGCSIVSPGCVNCYAMKQAHRFSWPTVYSNPTTGEVQKEGGPYEGLTKLTKAGPQWTGVVRTVEAALLDPLSWRKPSRVFVNSMSDLFHEDVPFEFVDKVFAVMALAGQHTFQVLTKRADRMRAYLSQHDVGLRWLINLNVASERHRDEWAYQEADAVKWSREGLPNVWLGVSVENQEQADKRIPLLLQTPAAVRWISAEPLLGPVTLDHMDVDARGHKEWCQINALTGRHTDMGRPCADVPRLDWVVVGGESGPGARPFDLAWARSIVNQCKAAGVACFVKQAGDVPMVSDAAWRKEFPDGRVRVLSARNHRRVPDGFVPIAMVSKGKDPVEWPEDLRVREYPEARS